jgi:hypothetical protein
MESLDLANKVYKIQDKEFKLKKRTFELRQASFIFIYKIRTFLKEYGIEITNIEEIGEEIGLILMAFYCNPNNLKEMFKLAFEEDINTISFDPENEDEYKKLTGVGRDLTLDFFYILGSIENK